MSTELYQILKPCQHPSRSLVSGLFLLFLLSLLTTAWTTAATDLDPDKDKDKRPLFDSFYLDGPEVTWVLSLRNNRTLDVISPDGKGYTGSYRASDGELAIKSPQGVLRHFKYDFDGGDLKLRPTKKDQPRPGDVLGTLPPTMQGDQAKFLTTKNWQAKGRPLTADALKQPAPAQESTPPVTIPKIAKAPTSVTGQFSFTDLYKRVHGLTLKPDGSFELTPTVGTKVSGTYVYVGGELSLNSGAHSRSLKAFEDPKGIQLERRGTDVLKLDDPLGEMPPQGRSPVLWVKTGEAPREIGDVANLEKPISTEEARDPKSLDPMDYKDKPKKEPIAEEPKTPDATRPQVPPRSTESTAPATAPVIESQEPKANPIQPPPSEPGQAAQPGTPESKTTTPKTVPAAPPQPAKLEPPPAKPSKWGLKELAGTYHYKPNALVTERILFKTDGTFIYSDSNEARAAGKLTVDGEEIILESGDVIRIFKIEWSENSIKLIRGQSDDPKISNDLATMSPSVLKIAEYKKQAE